MNLSRSTFYKRPDTKVRRQREASRAALREVIEDVAEEWPAYGYRRVPQEYELQYARQGGSKPRGPSVYLMGFTPRAGRDLHPAARPWHSIRLAEFNVSPHWSEVHPM